MDYAADELRKVADSIEERKRILPGNRIHEMTSSGMGGIRGLGNVTGNPAVYQAEDSGYTGKNVSDANQRVNDIRQRLESHNQIHGQMRSGHPTHGYHNDHAGVNQKAHINRVKGRNKED